MSITRFQCGAVLLACLGAPIGGSVPAAAAEEKRLYIYNWSDFIGPTTVAKFEALNAALRR